MFCTAADFNLLPYSIPNLSQVANTFQPYVDKKEAEMLKRLLGVALYNAAIAGHTALPPLWANGSYDIGDRVLYLNDIYEAIADNVNKPPDANPDVWLFIESNIWAPLGQGAIIVWDGGTCGGVDQQIEWLGIKDMLIPYIFYCWLRDTWDNNSGIGIVQGKAENSEVIPPARRLVDAYNDFVLKARTMDAFIVSSNTPDVVYPDYRNNNSCGYDYPFYPGTLNTFGL